MTHVYSGWWAGSVSCGPERAACRVPESSAWDSTAGGMSWAVGVLGSMPFQQHRLLSFCCWYCACQHSWCNASYPFVRVLCLSCTQWFQHSIPIPSYLHLNYSDSESWKGKHKTRFRTHMGHISAISEQSSCHESTPY